MRVAFHMCARLVCPNGNCEAQSAAASPNKGAKIKSNLFDQSAFALAPGGAHATYASAASQDTSFCPTQETSGGVVLTLLAIYSLFSKAGKTKKKRHSNQPLMYFCWGKFSFNHFTCNFSCCSYTLMRIILFF